MYTLKEAAAATGYTLDQTRKRLTLLASILDGSVQRGPRGAILLSEDTVGLLRRIHDLEASGHSLREAVSLTLGQVGPGRPTVDPGRATVTQGEAPDWPTPAQVGPTSAEAQLIRILWVLTGILGFATLAIVGLGVATIVTRY